MPIIDYRAARLTRAIDDRGATAKRNHPPTENATERERRILAHIARIRSDPRWTGNKTGRKASPAMVRRIREKYLERWRGLKRRQRTALQRELARRYRVSPEIIYRVMVGRYQSDDFKSTPRASARPGA